MKKPHTRLNGSLKAIKFPAKKINNDEEIELTKAMESAAAIFAIWKENLIDTRVPLDELKDKVNELHALIARDIRSEKYRRIILPMLDTKIAELSVIAKMASHSMAVDVQCEVLEDGWKKPCKWKGLGIIKKSEWEDGSVTITCPKCETTLDKDHMKPKDKK